eukprot:m.64932 g.64932  ORF g.64932 m.64932 type:complete len:511 (-) comp13627_c0_seq2:1795-3327(-)
MTQSLLLVLAATALLGGIISIAVISSRYNKLNKAPQYAVVVDAGSTHSQFYIYKWKPTPLSQTAGVLSVPFVEQHKESCKAAGAGISSYAPDPQNAGPSLQPCLDDAASSIPSSLIPATQVYLRATAGMRVVHENTPDVAGEILASVLDTFLSSDFSDDSSAQILPGEEEGAFGWVTANYITGTLQNQPNLVDEEVTYGALDLGGASTQISFLEPNATTYTLDLYGHQYPLYTHSYLCWGAKAATQRLNATLIELADPSNSTLLNPCLPSGFETEITIDQSTMYSTDYCSRMFDIPAAKQKAYKVLGTSDAAACQALTDSLLDNGTTRVVGDNVPAIPEGMHFYAFSAFYHFVDYICTYFGDFDPTICEGHTAQHEVYHPVLYNLSLAVDDLCAKNWTTLTNVSGSVPVEYLSQYCYQGKYVLSLLLQGYGFNASTNEVRFVDSVEGREVGWAFGFVVNETNVYNEASATSRGTTEAAFGGVMALGVFFLFAGLFMCLLRRAKRDSYMAL